MQALVSLHDVTPAHWTRLDRAEALLAAAGVNRVAYFVVPNFHRTHSIESNPHFADWCRRPRPFAVDWVLHGYYHVEDTTRSGAASLRNWLARRLMTGGEGEFLALGADRQRDRLVRGRAAVTSVIGSAPMAFVPPAWLFNNNLQPLLADLGFRYTEDHVHVTDVLAGTTRRCPVVSWATRTFVRRIGSRVVVPTLLTAFSRSPAIRIAIHPHDMEHRRTADQIRHALDRVRHRRHLVGYEDLFRL